MKINKTFGKCLKELIEIFNLNGSILAKGINVDSSLVYKWLRNERVPSYNSTHIDSISNFFVKNIINSYQKENIIKALEKYEFQISDNDPISILNAIHTYLIESQGYSIEFCKKNRAGRKRNKFIKNETLPKHLNITPKTNNARCKLSSKFILPSGLHQGTDNVKIIIEHKEILYSALELLETAQIMPQGKDDTILIAFNSTVDFLPNYKKFSTNWKLAIYNALNKGWRIILIIRLNNDAKRTCKIIKDMQLAISTGKCNIYYYNNDDMFISSEMLIVPKRGALYCFSTNLKNQVDSAFLFKSKKSIELLSKRFFMLFSSAKPLFFSYSTEKSFEFKQSFAEIEKNLGDRYVFGGNISSITLPINVYKKYLKMSGISDEEISLRLSLHRHRLDAFKAQISYYKYKDIWFKESLEELINENKFSLYIYYIFENFYPERKEIICHLENIINMLEKYENYEIAIVSKKDYENISNICCMVKENSSVLINADNTIEQEKIKHDYYSRINFLITDKLVVNAFQDYFLMIWDEISYSNKEKKEIIKMLKSKIDLLKNN